MQDVFPGAAGRGSADDDPACKGVLLPELANDASQPVSLVPGIDLAGHPDVIDRRHEHEEPPGHRHVRRDAGTLGAKRLLHHLHQDLLALSQQLVNLGQWTALAPVDRPVLSERSSFDTLRTNGVEGLSARFGGLGTWFDGLTTP